MGDRSDMDNKTIAKFSKIRTKNETPILKAGRGIFTSKTRKRIMGIMKQPEPGLSRNQFWWKRRNEVERALIDLRLFIEKAERDDVNQVITRESLTPVVEALLGRPIVEDDVGDLNLAEIAQLLIQNGFDYLGTMRQRLSPLTYDMPSSSAQTMNFAVELSHNLVSDIRVHEQALIQRRKELAKTKAAEQKEQTPAEPRKGDSKP
jgi:hypothetical protein